MMCGGSAGRSSVGWVMMFGIVAPLSSSAGAGMLPSPATRPIAGLFNTGLDESGVALPDGAVDPHWTLVGFDENGVVINNGSVPGSWLDNTSDSRWIWQTATGGPTGVTRTFRTTFNLTDVDVLLADIEVAGRWSADNRGLDILINGVPTGFTTGSTSEAFRQWWGFSITSGFVEGVNTLDFVVDDHGSIAGFRAELSGVVTVIPAPGALGLFGLAAAVGASRRRRRTRPRSIPQAGSPHDHAPRHGGERRSSLENR